MNKFTDHSVSVIIAAYNAEKWIDRTIDSVLNQSWKNTEIIVVNDGSTDNTGNILETYSDKAIKICHQANAGQDAALNAGFQQSSGSYIKFMDADDLINNEMVELQVRALNGSDEYIAYGEWGRFYNNDPGEAQFDPLPYWKDSAPVDFLTGGPAGVMLQCGNILLPRKIINEAGQWDERLSIFNDTEFFTRMILASKGIRFTKGARLYYRSGQAGSITSLRSRKSFESSLLAFSLIGKHLLKAENSIRVKNLVANLYAHRYHEMYPDFPDLGVEYENEIRRFGGATSLPRTSKIYHLASRLIGWKLTKKIHQYLSPFYRKTLA